MTRRRNRPQRGWALKQDDGFQYVARCFRPYGYNGIQTRIFATRQDARAALEREAQFQTDKYGDLSVRFSAHQFAHLSGWQPVKAADFNKAWRAVQKRIAELRP